MDDKDRALAPLDIPTGPAALLGMGYQVLRAENEALQSIAVLTPREPEKVLKAALKEFEMLRSYDPQAAEDYAKRGYYSIPYRDGDDTTFVEGLTVRSQERLNRLWGHCVTSARIPEEDANGYNIIGVGIDFETGWREERPLRVSKFQKRRGKVVLLSDREQIQAVQAGISKAKRNAGLAILPDWLRMIYFRKLKEQAAGDLTKPADTKKATAVVKRFGELGVPLEKLEEKLGRKRAAWTGDDLGSLIGLGEAIRDGEVDVEGAFGGGTQAPEERVLTTESVSTGEAHGQDDAQREVTAPVSEEPGAAEAAKLFDFEIK